MVELRRRKNSEPIERFKHNDDAELVQLRSRLLRWSTDNGNALRGVKPSMPETLDNRRADNWRLMLAIADLAGEDWGDKSRLAATKLEGASDTSTIGVRLLADVNRIFDEEGVDCMLSAALVERLKADEEGPWIASLTQNALATLWAAGVYKRAWFEGALGTVLPADNYSSFLEVSEQAMQACKPRWLLGNYAKIGCAPLKVHTVY
jgi:hypothetical protein